MPPFFTYHLFFAAHWRTDGMLESHDIVSASLIAFCGVSDIHLETCFMDGQIEFSINLTERPAGLPANQDVFINS